MNRIRKFLRLSYRQKARLIEASLWLGIFQLILLFLPFQYFQSLLGRPGRETARQDCPLPRIIPQLTKSIKIMSSNLPWNSSCLVRALALRSMLKFRRFDTTLYLGVQKRKEEFHFHAWLRWQNYILTGGEKVDNFRVLTAFS